MLNPTDNRGIRTIIGAHDKSNIRRFFNMKPAEFSKLNVKERIIKLATEWSNFLEYKFDCVAQMAILGNNSQSENDGKIVLGERNGKMEPYFYHFHVWLRLPQNREIYSGYNYLGPKMGDLFNLRHGKQRYDSTDRLIKNLHSDFTKFIKN